MVDGEVEIFRRGVLESIKGLDFRGIYDRLVKNNLNEADLNQADRLVAEDDPFKEQIVKALLMYEGHKRGMTDGAASESKERVV